MGENGEWPYHRAVVVGRGEGDLGCTLAMEGSICFVLIPMICDEGMMDAAGMALRASCHLLSFGMDS